jgi:hypothetical protein
VSAASEAIVCVGHGDVVPLGTQRERIKGKIAGIADGVDE